MIALVIPFLGFLALLVVALVIRRREAFHPSVVLSALYVAMAGLSILYGLTTEAISQFPNDAVESSTLLLFLIFASLLPGFLIKNPHFDLGAIRKHAGGMILGIAAIAGTVGFACLLPTFLKSISIDAYSAKSLGATANAEGSPLVTIGCFLGAFSGVFGVLLFGDTRFELRWMVRLGLLLGFLDYGVIMECNKSRDWIVYYVFYFLLYLWLFWDRWRPKMKIFCCACLVCLIAIGGAAFTIKTVERFGSEDSSSLSVAEGTFGYLGQQVANFIDVADQPDAVEGQAEINFPVYFYLVKGEWVDVAQLLTQRKTVIESSFSTYVGSLFLAVGRRWTVAALLVVAALAAGYFGGPAKNSSGTYVLMIMLYYQSLFQGVFYWMQGGRFGNGFIIVMLFLGITLNFKWGGRPAVRGL